MSKALFELRTKTIIATVVDEQHKKIIDINGETFIGLHGNMEIKDSDGNHYFMSQYLFNQKFRPINEEAILLLHEIKKEKMNLNNYVVQNIEDEKNGMDTTNINES